MSKQIQYYVDVNECWICTSLAKVNYTIASKIREIYKNNLFISHRDLAKKFNLSKSQITRILNNQTWKDSDYNAG